MWHVWEKGEMHTGVSRVDLRETVHLEDLGVDGRTILKLIFKKWAEESPKGLSLPRIETGYGACKCGNEPSSFIKRGEFLH
jgi:hypothetical protein